MRPNEELLQKIGIVRRKLNLFLWVRGLSWVLGVLVASVLIGLAVANTPSAPMWVVNGLRLGFVAAFLFTIWRALVVPLRRTPDDAQLARFIEEKNPGLQERLVSAIETIKKPRPEQGAFSHLLIQDALDRTKHVRFGEQINKRKFATFATLTGVFTVALLVSLYVASIFFPYGTGRMFAFNLLKPSAMDAYTIKVTPGDVTVPRGNDVIVTAIMSGFDAERAQIHLRYANGAEWETSTMEVVPESLPTYRHLLFNLQEDVHYFVEASGYKSDEFTITVRDLPRVEKLDYTYHFPGYTGLVDKKEEDASDMVALKGTVVDVVITASQALSGGSLIFADGKSIALQPTGEKMATAKVTIDRNTTFRIKLINSSRQDYTSLEEYSMEALDDQKPIISFTKPGRDTKATNVEEVFTELRAEDDFGVNRLELFFSVNGGPEQKVDLFANKGAAPKEISASHTFFLEEHELEPGDFVTYYGKAFDSRNPSNSVMTDIYFIEVRPFGKEYTQGQQQGGGGGGGGGGETAEALSKRQKEIIAATFNLQRDKEKFKSKEWTDNIHAVAEEQEKLAEQAQTVIERLSRRGLDDDKMIEAMSKNIEQAIAEMIPAAGELKKEKPDTAEPHEKKALQYLSRAEALFTQIQVTMGQQGGGGGGGGQNAQDLADLFELELDQNKNQYETLQRGEVNQNQQQAVQEAIDKLKELAERQQKAMERKAQQMQQGGGGGGASDQMNAEELQKETEKLARQLEKLSRENNDPQMSEVSKALQQAANNMKRQSQNGASSQQQQQAAQQAQEQLEKAQRLLQQGQGGNLDEQLAQLQQQAKDLKNQQSQIAKDTEQLAANPGTATAARQRAQQIIEEKKDIASGVKDMAEDLQSLSNNQENRDAANKARAANNAIRSGQIQDKIERGKQMLENGYYPYASATERDIEKAMTDLEKQISEAASAANDTDEKKLQENLNKASDAVRKLESMKRRLEDQQNQQGQQPGQQPGQQQSQGQGQGQGQQPGQQPGQGQGQRQGQQPGQQPGQGQGQGQGQQPSQQQGQGQGQGQGQQPGQQQGQGQGQQPGQQQGQGQGGGQNNQGGGQQNGFGGQRNNGQYAAGAYNAGGAPNFDPRQWTREFQERIGELQDLRNAIGRTDPEAARALDGVIRAAQAQVRDGQFNGDPGEIEALAKQILDPLRTLELALSRELQLLTAKDNIRSAKEEDIPPAYKKYVEEYYTGLSNQKP